MLENASLFYLLKYFEPLNKLHLKTSKPIKKFTLKYIFYFLLVFYVVCFFDLSSIKRKRKNLPESILYEKILIKILISYNVNGYEDYKEQNKVRQTMEGNT